MKAHLFQHSFQFIHRRANFLLQLPQLCHDLTGGRILHRLVLCLLILVDAQVIAIVHDFLPGYQEALLCPLAVGFGVQMAEAGNDIGDVVISHGASLVVQGEAVGLHVVEPHLVRAAVAGFGEDQDGGGDPGIGLEHAAGHGDDGLQPVAVHKLPADGPVGRGGAKQHAVGDDAGAAAAHLQHPKEQRQEQQLGFLGFADLQQVGGHNIIVQRPLEGRVGQDKGILGPVRVLVGQAIPVFNKGIIHAVGHHVHGADAKHSTIHIKAMEHMVHVVLFVLAIEENLILAVLF